MKIPQLIIITVLVTIFSHSYAKEKIIVPDTQSIISQWFSIDSQYDIKMDKSLITEDESIQKFKLSFNSDDQQKANGILVIPKGHKGQLKLALLMHAMGSSQNLWWKQTKVSGDKISTKLLQSGYAVLTLDARRHGKRTVDDLTAKDMIDKAHSKEPRLYTDMIIGTVRDYRIAFAWAQKELKIGDNDILVAGYSMGAQMSLLLASYEPKINQVMVMVPPFVSELSSPVAPRLHVSRIENAEILLLVAKQDPYSTQENTQLVFDNISSQDKSITWFESGHLLPENYYKTALSFIESLASDSQTSIGQ